MNDLRLAFRQLLKHPGFTAVAVLTLALGIGVNTSMFSALQVLLARPLPYRDPATLVQVFQSSPGSPRGPHHSVPNFLDYQERGDFEYLAALNDKPFNLSEPGEPAERVRGLQVSASLFPLLGIQPALGRWFNADEDQPGRNDVVILDHGFWQRRFLGLTNVIGRVLRLDGESVTVVGVMPPQFHDNMLMGPVCLWRPIAFNESQRIERGHHFLKCIGQVALCWNLPVRQFNVSSSFNIDGRPEPPRGSVQECSVNGVTPGYFETLGMRLLDGRAFTAADNTNQPPVVIINETMARVFWPESSPIGQRVNGAEIVGVVNNVRFPANPAEIRTPFQTYRPWAQEPRGGLNIALRGHGSPELLRRVVAEVDPDQPVGDPGPVRAEIARSLDNWGLGGKLLSLFALLGLSLAALGIYGVISGFVVRSTGEIGVRMALGAQLHNVLWLVIDKGLRLTLIGAAIGLVGAWGISRLLATALPELPDSDPSVLGMVVLLLVAVTILACWLPARRATRVDPMEALRSE